MYQGLICLIKPQNTDLTNWSLEKRFIDRDVMSDLVDGDDQREVTDHLRQAAREAKTIHVAPVAEVDLRLNWTTSTGAREIAMDQQAALHVEVQLLSGAVAGRGFNYVNLAIAFPYFAEQLRLRIHLAQLRVAIKIGDRKHHVFRKT